ncbi:MAG TPA: phage tail protein [Actinophytocola sp.]|uniref:phage tail protein n=1 Tax=Actinophytocola sp. TaxID=1872138 RepID=UPI002DDD48EE|nr:phage tail protein [Actinophytocola sp.]HEV2783969.1 phage tail protein [Actinophytocola sp.]
MRNGAVDPPVRHPIGDRLPGIYLENGFTLRLVSALDEVLAPVIAVLDGFADYLDPSLAPKDFLDWLTHWVALDVDERWSQQQRRDLVGHAVELHRWRGTTRGLAAHVRLLTGGEVEIVDSGGCVAANRPGQPLPGTDPARVLVRVRVADPAAIDRRWLTAAIADAVPVHVAVTVEVATPEGVEA